MENFNWSIALSVVGAVFILTWLVILTAWAYSKDSAVDSAWQERVRVTEMRVRDSHTRIDKWAKVVGTTRQTNYPYQASFKGGSDVGAATRRMLDRETVDMRRDTVELEAKLDKLGQYYGLEFTAGEADWTEQ